MHIAWLGKKAPFCGNVTYSREITNKLKDKNYQISFLHFAQLNTHHKSAVDDVFLPCLYKSQIYTIPTPQSSQVLIEALKELRPDIVHASLTLSPLDFLLPEICAELKIPLMATFHPPFALNCKNFTSNTQYLLYQLYAPFLSNYNAVIVFSEIQKSFLQSLGVPKNRLVVIPNGVDHHKYSPGNSYLKQLLKTECIFIYQGRIAAEKNIESLLQAWKLANMSQHGKLIIMGNGPLVSSLIHQYGPEYGIIWLGFVKEELRRIEILRGADVFILPSLVEGLSLSLLEAMSCELACIATDVGADGEVLTPDSGILLSTKNIVSQLEVLLPLMARQDELRKLLANKARKKLLQFYTLEGNITQLEQVYKEVLSNFKQYN
uniref:Glycosyltransferase n=1 Tax=Sciadococcus taiwanensis TaxID=3028030 RepID=A0A9Y1I203_9RHOD|nr:hypothetical protein SCTW_007 [Sciadococcus taiwanensis]